MRHRGGHSSIGLDIGRLLFSEVMKSSYRPKWRISNNIKQCTLCGKCEFVCPTNAIAVSVHNRTWTLNNRLCSHCLHCIMKCPKHCLTQLAL
ncbi:4Fe-4S dicluster domain-containing protein [Methanobrevibacter sp.]|uniref:4Fe-4S dicluster domain-containing protein n=1 Tax=Methanobrevibacter sp. TaxID=66852 RepID=UPI00389037E7